MRRGLRDGKVCVALSHVVRRRKECDRLNCDLVKRRKGTHVAMREVERACS
ncbi:hypothetical protein COCC4DRAFT_33119 [Bipolaris maydis ATCC 48331]|uniref:Uncharacterized protein n=2 Tax=Cochliobolus heterostrophus TaxID=5016 RepID=M2TN76_COCH5|nr:uncharacterized protein COCC4DRAFT_33119 [Bipolaris maydis ATCC 48331]EMD87994.1 hypothetical protein COCHEDRAFT_1023264 [Bipolaris maydis C5]ENI03510.1 hypothetical protein COCC4DRAFT_33119 [Bipolaris maydis ATCC 48331]